MERIILFTVSQIPETDMLPSKCPVCGSLLIPGKTKCTVCHWDLTAYSLSKPKDILRKAETWARIALSKLNKYKLEMRQFKQKMAEYNHELLERIARLEDRVKNLEERIQLLENEKENSEIKTQNIYHSEFIEIETDTETTEVVAISSQSPQKNSAESRAKPVSINPYEQQLIDCYNQNPTSLQQYSCSVNLTKSTLENIYLNPGAEIIFEPSKFEEYLVVELPNSEFRLLPHWELKINTNMKAIMHIFHIQGDPKNNRKFRIIKTAKVVPHEQEKWRLVEKGILQFQ
ncbi:MAG: hypothetical protein NZM30_03355 [Geminocystis sp.]|nr:hypothetical protein [Geminocystis sp.]